MQIKRRTWDFARMGYFFKQNFSCCADGEGGIFYGKHASAKPRIRRRMLLNRLFCANLNTLDVQRFFTEKRPMKNPLDSISGTLVSGVILTLVLYVFLKNFILAGV
ncbi:hypothetical protein [Methylovorus mays]|uniref:hypothetical protein n=1 Tax=Methylovorus mays TaxID=184077 RepID=UPI001E48482E|nr:hypothetical protein [Methylovorus mays]MCB5206141.1 hypothetical protein [Methylovorus mays]